MEVGCGTGRPAENNTRKQLVGWVWDPKKKHNRTTHTYFLACFSRSGSASRGVWCVTSRFFSNSLPEPSLHPPSRVSPPSTRTHARVSLLSRHARRSIASLSHTHTHEKADDVATLTTTATTAPHQKTKSLRSLPPPHPLP